MVLTHVNEEAAIREDKVRRSIPNIHPLVYSCLLLIYLAT